jgi:hypothetical protein
MIKPYRRSKNRFAQKEVIRDEARRKVGRWLEMLPSFIADPPCCHMHCMQKMMQSAKVSSSLES